MKRFALRLIAVILSLSVVCPALFSAAAADSSFEKEISYSFHGVKYVCTAVAVLKEKTDKETDEITEYYDITFSFQSIDDPITAQLTSSCFSIDNSQPGMEHVYRQDLWNVIASFCLELYRNAYGEDMQNRSPDGAERELMMHYWIYAFTNRLLQMITPITVITDKVPQFAKMTGLLKTVYRRARITELGPNDGHTDLNSYVFEQANSNLQSLFLYGMDFLSLDFMDELVDYTNRLEAGALEQLDQLLFYPTYLERIAELQRFGTLNIPIGPCHTEIA